MEHLAAVLNWFKARELEVRRLYARDDDFRCACEDFVVATNALFHWERDENNMVRAEEYPILQRNRSRNTVPSGCRFEAQRVRTQRRSSTMINHQQERET